MKRILIVQNNVTKCLALSDMLNEFGFETGVSDSSERTLLMLADADPLPDAILLDLNMPNMEGWNLRETLRCHERYSKIPVIVMTDKSCIVAELENPAHAFPQSSFARALLTLIC